jgi:membrane-associated protein
VTVAHHLLDLSPALVYLVVGALVFSEAALFVGFVLPGETAALLGGVLAAAGRVSLGWLLVLVVVAAVVGDTVGYEVGRHLGTRLLATRPMSGQGRRLDGARRYLQRRGGSAVFVGRFTAFLRAVMPALAGTSGMPYGRFLAFNAAGGIVWGVGVVLAGYFAGASYDRVAHWLGRGSAVLLALVVVAVVVVWLIRRRKQTDDELSGNSQD